MTTTNTSTATLLTDIVSRWATTMPYATALKYEDREYTFSQLGDRARAAAAALQGAGLSRGDRVAFLDKNHPACLEIMLGAASIGVATVVLNWRLAADELTYMIDDTAAAVLVVGAEFLPLIDSIRNDLPTIRRTIVVGGDRDTYEQTLASARWQAPTDQAQSEDDCLIMYSSGTTGRPKGVTLSQRALIAHTLAASTVITFADGDSNLVAMPLFHVGGVSYALLGIHAGVQTVLLREPDPHSLLGALAGGATHAFFVPPVITALLGAGGTATAAMASMKILAYGAAPMPLPILQRALAAWPTIEFIQVYGQTEVSGLAAALSADDHRNSDHPEWLTSAGIPIPGVELRVVDPESTVDVPLGAQGEIWFRTAQTMTGYLNRADATAETLTAEGWLRTGDIGRIDETRHLYVEDRIKDMIITGGENVYGPEVERVLLEHPAVLDAAVIGVPDEKWGESVKAILVLENAADRTRDELVAHILAHAHGRLASYKVPKSVEHIDVIPRNASGKILKKDLRAFYI
ncbi:long-chain-fatty-acid--CoA ligase [Antrihabitans sp. YC3-6]|uniref:Long-chain-fatty-acid--CoA ligase n=1 Tax=Antrihabitans stalagmiti TaxID=2799499 RepID=A0A934NV52_9NOCA|nr:long-chain-fatty-acid--CoA ligase [Antrihabitans stalagmiti]MBJ8342116.1 long-chain-fatty-acid--CoA ligase [Antrihabitans stalagmiti]